jgi:hypothetical protein
VPLDKNEPYILVNLILAGIIALVFIYSGLFSPDKARHPIPSNAQILSGENPYSKGLSRAFSSIIRLEFKQAREYNKDSIRIFSFFLLQFFMRLSLIPLYKRFNKAKAIILTDIILSGSLFIAAFFNFITHLYSASLPG